MNNINEFYKKKELLNTVESNTANRYMFYVSNEGDNLLVRFNNDLNSVLGQGDKRSIFDMIKEELTVRQPIISEQVIKKLAEDMEYSRKQVKKDFLLNDIEFIKGEKK